MSKSCCGTQLCCTLCLYSWRLQMRVLSMRWVPHMQNRLRVWSHLQSSSFPRFMVCSELPPSTKASIQLFQPSSNDEFVIWSDRRLFQCSCNRALTFWWQHCEAANKQEKKSTLVRYSASRLLHSADETRNIHFVHTRICTSTSMVKINCLSCTVNNINVLWNNMNTAEIKNALGLKRELYRRLECNSTRFPSLAAG
jgi:hypothetical protein